MVQTEKDTERKTDRQTEQTYRQRKRANIRKPKFTPYPVQVCGKTKSTDFGCYEYNVTKNDRQRNQNTITAC